MNPKTDECRDAFEKWYLLPYPEANLLKDGAEYLNDYTQIAWLAWQAAYSAPKADAGKEKHDMQCHIDELLIENIILSQWIMELGVKNFQGELTRRVFERKGIKYEPLEENAGAALESPPNELAREE